MNAMSDEVVLPRTRPSALAPAGLLVLVLLPLLLMPLAAIFIFAFGSGLRAFWNALRTPDAQFALRFSLLIAFATARNRWPSVSFRRLKRNTCSSR